MFTAADEIMGHSGRRNLQSERGQRYRPLPGSRSGDYTKQHDLPIVPSKPNGGTHSINTPPAFTLPTLPDTPGDGSLDGIAANIKKLTDNLPSNPDGNTRGPRSELEHQLEAPSQLLADRAIASIRQMGADNKAEADFARLTEQFEDGMRRFGTYQAQLETFDEFKTSLENGLSFTEAVDSFNRSNGIDVQDGVLTGGRMHSRAPHKVMWEQMGGTFTEAEQAHFDNIENAMSPEEVAFRNEQIEARRFLTFTREEIELLNSLSPDARAEFMRNQRVEMDRLSAESRANNNAMERGTTAEQTQLRLTRVTGHAPATAIPRRGTTSGGLGAGLAASIMADQFMEQSGLRRVLDDGQSAAVEGSISGALFGRFTSMAVGATAQVSAATALGYYTQRLAFKAVKARMMADGADERAANTAAGAAGGATGAATTGGVMLAGEMVTLLASGGVEAIIAVNWWNPIGWGVAAITLAAGAGALIGTAAGTGGHSSGFEVLTNQRDADLSTMFEEDTESETYQSRIERYTDHTSPHTTLTLP